MAWLESLGNLARHPKTRRLMRRMEWTLPATIGNLHLLWYWALEYAPTGELTRFDPEQLTYDLDLGEGTPEEFLEAMVQAGFMDRSENGGIRLHDWPVYTAKSLRPRFRRHPERWHRVLRSYGLPVPARRPSRRKEIVEHAQEEAVRGQCIEEAARKEEAKSASPPDLKVSQIDFSSHAGQQPTPKVAEDPPVEIPQSLSAQAGFTDTWWPKFIEMYDDLGCPLSSYEQGELLNFLSKRPFTATSYIRAALNNPRKPSRSTSVEGRDHFANST